MRINAVKSHRPVMSNSPVALSFMQQLEKTLSSELSAFGMVLPIFWYCTSNLLVQCRQFIAKVV